MQLKQDFKVLDFMQTYQTDFTDRDKKILYGYKGDFILAVRRTGTNLLKLWKEPPHAGKNNRDLERELDSLRQNLSVNNETYKRYNELNEEIEYRYYMKKGVHLWIKRYNQKFYFGSEGTVKEVSKDEIDDIITNYNKYKLFA